MKKKILLIFNDPIILCPRPRRLLLELSKRHDVYFICPPGLDEQYDGRRYGQLLRRIQSPFIRWLNAVSVKSGFFWLADKIKPNSFFTPDIKDGEFDYLFVHDLCLLPCFINLKKTKVIFDAREAYTIQYANDDSWASIHGKLNYYACKKYMPLVYKVITVSPSLVDIYQKLLRRKILLFPSFPREELRISSKEDRKISHPVKLIHHGYAIKNRGLERMIDVMELLGHDYHLDMMMVINDNRYYEKLKIRIKKTENVNVIPPVHPDEIMSVCHQYDLGFFLMENNTSQAQFCLPNKYFEFLFAGLPIITNNSVDMKHYTETYQLGLGFINESDEEIAEKIKELTSQNLQNFRRNINKHAPMWTVYHNLRDNFPEFF